MTRVAGPADVTEGARSRVELYWPGLLMAMAATSMTVGIIWDISWHVSIGRDTFWTPAHMAIQFGGVLAGGVGAWLALRGTFFGTAEERAAAVRILGVRAPLGAWVAMWGCLAMLTSAPFDDWWHNAYGLDVKIVSPPHTVLGLGMLGISLGALLLGLAHQNRVRDAAGDWLFIYIGGIFLTLGCVFLMEFSTPNLQHAATFYAACAGTMVIRLVALGVAGRMTWPATRAALVCMALECLMTWILPLFPAEPKLAPIFNPVTHMVPPPFPLLLVFPALALDAVLRWTGTDNRGWRRVALALGLGAAFLAVFAAVQWFFAAFLLTPAADNWFFAGNRYWGYQSSPGKFAHVFWHVTPGQSNYDPIHAGSMVACWLIAAAGSWLGLLWGGWMKKVQR
jgi:hypothetical protein